MARYPNITRAQVEAVVGVEPLYPDELVDAFAVDQAEGDGRRRDDGTAPSTTDDARPEAAIPKFVARCRPLTSASAQ